MENFEYSVQLNDRDWAEFYLASEECSVIQPTLATADDQFFGDLEEGEAEEKRWPPVRAHGKTGCFSHESPLPANEVWSGSDDETDLGSVSRFLCSSHQGLPSSHSLRGPFSSISLKPLRSWHRLPGPATTAGTAFEALEKGAEIVTWPMEPETKVKAPAFPGTVLQEPHPTQEAKKRICESPVNLSASEGMESPVGASGVDFQCPLGRTSQDASADIRCSSEGTAVAGKPDSPETRDAALYPSSICFSPAISFESGGVENPGKDGKVHPLAWRAEATPSQERHSPPPGHSDPAGRALDLPIPILAGVRERTSGGREEGVRRPLERARGTGPHRRVSPNIWQGEQLGGPPCDRGAQQFPGGLGKNGRPSPAQGADQTWEKPGGEVGEGKGAPCLRCGTASPLEEEYPAQVQGGQRLVSRPLKPKGSSESHVTDFTWPEMYDYFFSDATLEVEGKMLEEAPGMDTDQLPLAVSGPEIYEYFFNEMEGSTAQKCPKTPETFPSSDCWSTPSDVLEEPGTNVTAYALCVPEVYEHFFAHPTRDRRNWRQNFLAVPVSEVRKAVRALKSLVSRPADSPRSQLRRRGSQARLVVLSPTLLEKGHSGRPENLGMAVVQPERPLQPVFTHRDMCVGFVAFASWAVKSSDLEAPDAWKIVLLANFGTLSAIRYFRRQVVTEGRHGT